MTNGKAAVQKERPAAGNGRVLKWTGRGWETPPGLPYGETRPRPWTIGSRAVLSSGNTWNPKAQNSFTMIRFRIIPFFCPSVSQDSSKNSTKPLATVNGRSLGWFKSAGSTTTFSLSPSIAWNSGFESPISWNRQPYRSHTGFVILACLGKFIRRLRQRLKLTKILEGTRVLRHRGGERPQCSMRNSFPWKQLMEGTIF